MTHENKIKKILDWMKKDGVPLVITAVVVFFMVLFGMLGYEYLKTNIEDSRAEKSHIALESRRMEADKDVQHTLDRLALQTKSCRTRVFEYHNGATGFGGLPFVKMSCTYETTIGDARSEADSSQNMPLSLYSVLAESLNKYSYVVLDVNNRSDIESTLGYETLQKKGIAVSVRVRITNANKRAIGFVAVDYEEPPDEYTLQEAIKATQNAALEIGALLSVKK